MKPAIRNHRLIYTYLSHPEKQVKPHLLVSTMRHEGYNPENNYTEEAETMAFQAWSVSADPRGILQRTHDTAMPLYAAHQEVVSEFLSRGFRKIKTIVSVMPEGVDQQIRSYQRTRA